MIRTNRPIPFDQVELLVWDLDGTLVDSKLDLAHSVNAMLRQYHRPELPLETVASYIGDGAAMLIRRALGDPKDGKFVQEALDFFLAYYREHKLDNTYVYAGIEDVLKALSMARDGSGPRRQAVLSNKPVRPSRDIVKGLGLGSYFVQVYGGNSFETKKPDPLGALKLMEECKVRPEHALMIGDSQNDILTARNAGMWSLGVTYGFSPESLEKVPPDVLVDTPEEIRSALLG